MTKCVCDLGYPPSFCTPAMIETPSLFLLEWRPPRCWFKTHLVSGQLYGLEKFWAFLKYSKIKNQPIDPKLQEHLRQFKNLEDFRVVVSVLLLNTVFPGL